MTRDEHAIRITGVSKRFGDLEVLTPSDLVVRRGEVVTLIGPSGCGKTTLLRMIAGLESPSSGSITVDGEPPATARRSKRVGFVPQAPALLPWRTVAANARLLLDLNRRSNRADLADPAVLLDRVGLAAFADALPHELSGGMQQRVALVRAFALGSEWLVMDEPFAALDEITRADMRHLLAELADPTGAGVVFVTHSLPEAVFLSDRIVVLSSRPGRIVGIVDVDLPRPRRPDLEDTAEFFALETAVRHLLHRGART